MLTILFSNKQINKIFYSKRDKREKIELVTGNRMGAIIVHKKIRLVNQLDAILIQTAASP